MPSNKLDVAVTRDFNITSVTATPVSLITDLAGLDASERTNGKYVFVDTDAKLYRFNSASTATDADGPPPVSIDTDGIVIPDDNPGSGRWLEISALDVAKRTSHKGTTVVTIPDLAGIALIDRTNGQRVFVDEVGFFYEFNDISTVQDANGPPPVSVDTDGVVISDDNPSLGRWLRIQDQIAITQVGNGLTKFGDKISINLTSANQTKVVKTVTTGNHALSGLSSVNGQTISANDRILVLFQTTASQNGIYAAQSGAWVRATDAASNDDFNNGQLVFAKSGSLYRRSFWILHNSPATIVVGTSAINYDIGPYEFNPFSGGGSIRIEVPSIGFEGLDGKNLSLEASVVAGEGLEVGVGFEQLRVKTDAVGGTNLASSINRSANGLAVKVDDSTIEEGVSGRLRVKDGGIFENHISSGALGLGLTGGSGVQIQIATGLTEISDPFSWVSGVSSPATRVDTGDCVALNLPDSVTTPVSGMVVYPKNGTTGQSPAVVVKFVPTVTGTGAGNVRLVLTIKRLSTGDLTTEAAVETLTSVVAVTNTQHLMHEVIFTLTPNFTPDDLVSLKLERTGGHAADTYDGTIGIIEGAQFRFQRTG